MALESVVRTLECRDAGVSGVKLMVLPGKGSLLEMLQQRGADAVRTAMAEAIPLVQALTA